jgi:hypothetical protein
MRNLGAVMVAVVSVALLAASGWLLLDATLPGVVTSNPIAPAGGEGDDGWRVELPGSPYGTPEPGEGPEREPGPRAKVEPAKSDEPKAAGPDLKGWVTWVPIGQPVPAGVADIQPGGDDILFFPQRPEAGTVHKARLAAVPALPESAAADRVTFPQLASIRRSFIDGLLTQVPPEFQVLDGKAVTLTGYIVVPFGTQAVSDFFLAHNVWDGCCIGKPPTLFDAVAVQMKEGGRLKNPRLWVTTVRGTFHVRPVYENDTLTGLFSLVEAVEVEAER